MFNLDEITSIHTSPYRLYHSLGQVIRSKIQSGEWAVGKQIPSERMLIQAFGVSRATVRQAIENLVKEGILYRQHGKGTFVAPPKIIHGTLRILDFTTIMKRNGLTPSSRLLGKELYIPPLDIRRALELPESHKVFYIERLLSVNNLPMVIENTYIPAARFPGLLDNYIIAEEPLTFINHYYGIQISKESESFEPVILENYEANLLGVKLGFPALWVEYHVYDAAGGPVTFITALLRGDRCRFYIDLSSE